MDSPEPEQTPFAAVTAQTSRLQRRYQALLDSSTPYVAYRWLGTLVAYSLGIYLLNLFLAFLQPKFNPSNELEDNEMEDGTVGTLPTKNDEEFRPFIRRLPEFNFWHSATRAICFAFLTTWFSIFDIPVFWPILVVYWLILFTLTSEATIFDYKNTFTETNILISEETDSTHD
ncbi:RER1 protein [Erysiphe pulchra]|uniref:Protein RER1 n=1 Tax=Erysiphe pulchra TaxID=225359 RepID=A0A2S4PPJ6_9PEZI|nr:RER1 protein [Erysiphe pulchra]